MAKLITAVRAAEILAVSVQRVYELARVGVLPAGVVVRLGRQIRLNEAALMEWVHAGGQDLPGGWRREPAD
jgi:excisionase family DNA binding protein